MASEETDVGSLDFAANKPDFLSDSEQSGEDVSDAQRRQEQAGSPRADACDSSDSLPEASTPEEKRDPGADPEALTRVSSGPAFTVFSKKEKRWIVTMVTIATFISPMTANIYFPALNPISEDLGVSLSLINLSLTTYMILQAISPTIFGDFGDAAGRRPAFIIAIIIYIGANIGLALQDNYAALLILRMVQSGGSSGCVALGYATVADIAVSAERGKYMGIVGAGINIGPALSPVVGGILAEYLGWRSIFWFCMIFASVWLIPYALAVPETCRKVVGNGSVRPPTWNMSLLDYLRFRRQPVSARASVGGNLHFPNPLKALRVIFEIDVGMIIFYNSIVYLDFMMITATLSTQFKKIYGYNNLQVGLCYLPYGIGCCAASVIQGYVLDWNYRRLASQIGLKIDMKHGDDLSHFPIEKARTQPLYYTISIGAAAVIAYGWALQAETSLAAPLVILFVVGLCITGSFSILSTFVVDLYPQRPATAVAATNLFRCLLGAGGTAVIEKMLRVMGAGWCFTFFGLLAILFSPILYVSRRWGPMWRENRRLRLQGEAERKAARRRAGPGTGDGRGK